MRKWFSSQKLNVKFTLVVGLIVVMPFIAVYFVVFQNLKYQKISSTISNTEYAMNQNYSEIRKTVELCNMSTQVFLNNKDLNDFLIELKRETNIKTSKLVEFYRNDIGMLEKLVNSNPYLYQIRVYASSNDFSEMMPILFKRERMDSLSWAKSYESGHWQLDYKDTVFADSTINSSNHIMALVTSMEDYDMGEIGVLEVAVEMEQVFPGIFVQDEEQWACFVDQNENVFAGTKEIEQEYERLLKDGLLQKKIGGDLQTPQFFHTKWNKDNVVIGYLPVKELSGYLMSVYNLENSLSGITFQRNAYLAGLFIIFALLFILVNAIVKALLSNFYRVIGTIRQVQTGDLNVEAMECGEDEIGELGNQINKMLDRIRVLMAENIDRELLMKNSEIRALQNQINAHFIYNVLESIKMMAEIKGEFEISDGVTSLGRLLRYSMRWVSNHVTIEQEVQYIKDYLSLMNLRFDYQIQLSLKIPELVYMQEIPKMSLQPIIENAIYHGIEELAEDSVINIKAKIFENDCTIEITDSGKGMTKEEVRKLEQKIAGEIESSGGSGNGIGLKNVQDRIRISFGQKYGIHVVSMEGCYTKVIVCIPLTHLEVKH